MPDLQHGDPYPVSPDLWSPTTLVPPDFESGNFITPGAMGGSAGLKIRTRGAPIARSVAQFLVFAPGSQ